MTASYSLVTVNNAPARAKILIGRVAADLGGQYDLKYVGNAESPEEVKKVVEEHKPDILFTASMWTPEQSDKAIADAKSVKPDIKTLVLPQGLQVEKGPDAVVEYIKEHLPKLLG